MHHRLYDFQLLQQDNQFHHRHRREWLYVAFVELEESSGRKRGWMRISGWANHMSNCSSLWLRERSELNSCNFIGLEVLEDALITTQSQLCQIFCQTRYRTSYLFWSVFCYFPESSAIRAQWRNRLDWRWFCSIELLLLLTSLMLSQGKSGVVYVQEPLKRYCIIARTFISTFDESCNFAV